MSRYFYPYPKTFSSNTVFFMVVVLDNDGKSRGYGFVRFKDETDQQRALIDMQHFTGLGKKPIKVSMATPKRYR